MRAGGGVTRMRWKEYDGKYGELGGKRGKQEGASEGEKMKGSRNEERKDRKTREERKRPKGRDRHGEEDLFSK